MDQNHNNATMVTRVRISKVIQLDKVQTKIEKTEAIQGIVRALILLLG